MKAPGSHSRIFVLADNVAFGGMSGDVNPMHVDPVAARRLRFGAPVVHGMHLVLWALEHYLSGRPLKFSRLAADFVRPVLVGNLVELSISEARSGGVKFRLSVAGQTRATVSATFDESSGPGDFDAPPMPLDCRDRAFEEMNQAVGTVALGFDTEELSRTFPNLARHADRRQLAVCLAATRLVGMECPGLHSIFSRFDFKFSVAGGDSNGLDYRVTEPDERFQLVRIPVVGPGVSGDIVAVFRVPPVIQRGTADLAGLIPPGAFAGARALIVGGSRGLGEVAAKLFARGGGRVDVTYNAGAADAQAVVRDIVGYGGRAECHRLDVLDPESIHDFVRGLGVDRIPSHLFYFAAPMIEPTGAGGFSLERFDLYRAFFVDAFTRLAAAVAATTGKTPTIIYPSTSFLDGDRTFAAEYCAAKAAGEIVCQTLVRRDPKARVLFPRLPPLLTDQTAAVSTMAPGDPAPVIARLLMAGGKGG